MSLIPVTSTTLLKDISGDANSARWSEFVARYRPMMQTYLRERFPFLEHDDVIQETLLTLVAKLPSYRYVPNETGYFHNYLTGIRDSHQNRFSLLGALHDLREADDGTYAVTDPPRRVRWLNSAQNILIRYCNIERCRHN